MLDAALRMGRDPTPWLAWSPRLAWAEIIARQSPLFAFLTRSRADNGSGSGFAIEPNAVFLEGTETTARAAFGYRLGMTMADWACRALMGLGPTTHAETAPPPGAGAKWSTAQGLPDLTGVHPHDGRTWLIEAKGGRKVGLRALRKGANQLSQAGIMKASHTRVLCGASIEHRLTVTLDIENWSPQPSVIRPRRIENDDDYLLDTTRSRMLTYYALSALLPNGLAVLPVGTAVSRQRDRTGLLTSLEDEPTTVAARSQPPRRAAEPYDLVVGQVPNTTLYVGMSRRQYGACKAVAEAQEELFPSDDWIASRHSRAEVLDFNDNEVARRIRQRDIDYLNRVRQERLALEATARAGFDDSRDRSWESMLGRGVERIRAIPDQFIEAATEDTYLAIDRRSLA